MKKDVLTISLDTIQTLLTGVATAAWAALALIAKWFHGRLKKVEQDKAGTDAVAHVSAELSNVASDLEVVKRVLFLVAHQMGIPAEALNR